MRTVVYSRQALDDLERIAEFLANASPEMSVRIVELILGTLSTLAPNPFIGRPVRSMLSELIISSGKTGYVALYRVTRTRVEVLAVRHQREAGYH